ncbi:hypothetical protein QOZ80_8AG0623130 [Eleusine coracana subsp. coracana]|nr:hypothetical protein QOZ80_8AG0623130 [Eleusine coracana subsp. coracana]
MGASQRSENQKTASRWAPETERGTHRFEITNYSLLKAFRPDEFIQSATFTVGGNNWCISYWPSGHVKDEDEGDDEEDPTEYVSVYLQRLHKTTELKALCNIWLLNPATGASSAVCSHDASWGARNFLEKSALEASFVQGDCLIIECDVTVIMGTPMSRSETVCEIKVPPSDVLDSLGNLLGDEKWADVKFKVDGEVFHAHKFVLAMRSPVFEAELYGPMRDKKMKTIPIEDMQPAVFKGMLHFIYKDSLPAMDDLDEHETREMVKHLLVAADSQLKDACIGFINSSNMLVDVLANPVFARLKRACPAVIAEICGKSAKSRKIRF